MALLETLNLTKSYGGKRGGATVKALDGVDLAVDSGEFVAIMGASGSGKTTLLQLLGTIETPTAGEILLGGQSLSRLKGADLARFRRRQLGFIFQEYNLMDALTLKENIMLPMVLEKRPPAEIAAKVTLLADRMGIAAVLDHYPYEVSGGQKQRASAVRAIVNDPALVLADEPTGALDSKSAAILMAALERLNADVQTTILMVTHDAMSASYCRRVLFIKDGRLFTELRRSGTRTAFFHAIMDVIAQLGGEPDDALHPGG